MARISSHLLKLILAAACLLSLEGARLPAGSSVSPSISLDQLLRPIQLPGHLDSKPVEEVKVAQPKDKPVFMRLTVDQVMDRLAGELSGNLEAGDKLELSCKGDFKFIQVPTDASWYVYTDDPFSPDTRGNWFPRISLEVNGGLKNTWRLPLKVALYRTVHMATHRLDRGETPRSPSIKPVVTNIYELRGSPISANVDLSEYELIQPVAEGRFLSWDDVTRRPDIRRGDMVEAQLGEGALTITLVAMSLESGVVGDTITLRNTRSRQEFSGIVSGNKRVQVIN